MTAGERVGGNSESTPSSAAASATSIREVGAEPTETVAGQSVALGWEAFTATGARATTFAAVCRLAVTDFANGSGVRGWVNASDTAVVPPSSNGTFEIPSPAWNAGLLQLSVDPAQAVPLSVQLFGSALPSTPAPVPLTVLPDVDHLVLYDPGLSFNNSTNRSFSSSTLWHVHDRFGDPAPGATLVLEVATASGVNETFLPVLTTTGGITIVWVNYSVPAPASATVTVLDGAGDVLWGPVATPAFTASATNATGTLSSESLAAVGLIALGGFAGIVVLLAGGRRRPRTATEDGEAELRRLAEGRATVVDMIRKDGPLALEELEARWEPPPAPPAVADWLASLVADGTLTATIGEGGRARFVLTDHAVGEPRVTLDEDALRQGLERRDAAVERTDESDPPER